MCSSPLSPNYRFHIAKVTISIFSTNNFLFFLSFLFHFLWLWMISDKQSKVQYISFFEDSYFCSITRVRWLCVNIEAMLAVGR